MKHRTCFCAFAACGVAVVFVAAMAVVLLGGTALALAPNDAKASVAVARGGEEEPPKLPAASGAANAESAENTESTADSCPTKNPPSSSPAESLATSCPAESSASSSPPESSKQILRRKGNTIYLYRR